MRSAACALLLLVACGLLAAASAMEADDQYIVDRVKETHTHHDHHHWYGGPARASYSAHHTVAHAAAEEPCYPAPCSGTRRGPRQLSPTVVQVPYPVPIYKNKLRVVRLGPKKHPANRKYLLSVSNPPPYLSSKPRCNSTIVEADKRALAQIVAKIGDRRRAVDRHDHWLLDAKRAVEIVNNELTHTKMKRQLVRNQIQDLVNIRTAWTKKLRRDEISWDLEQAQRTMLQLNDHKEILQAHADDVRRKYEKTAKKLAKLNEHLAALPKNLLDTDDLEDFDSPVV